ncbi:HTH CENPB-type domain-containing protein [Trichonephila clavipes]|nr:HTH CENPB-type domain-containing protein [Trichonephila clavipes]
MRQCRGQNIPMSGSLLKEKAKAFTKELGIEFSASEGWLTNFKKRNGIVFKKMCRESSSVDINPLDQGIIHNFKTSYRREVVKGVLDNLENQQHITTISILTALMMIDKAWRAVTPLTIHSCFKNSSRTRFDDYVLVDTDIAVWGALSDAEIVALDHNNTESDED